MLILFFILLGIADTAYLSYEHATNFIPPCPAHSILGSFIDCGKVLSSSYSQFLGIPVAYLGLFYFLILLFLYFKISKKLLFLISIFALIASVYLVYLQFFVLHAICIYCMVSAGINFGIFFALLTEKFLKDILKT